MLKFNKIQILLATLICLKPIPSFGMETSSFVEDSNKNDELLSSSIRIKNIDGFTDEQEKETEIYVQAPQKLLKNLITALREEGQKIYKFNISSDQDTSMLSHAGKFKEVKDFLLNPKNFCKEEIEVTNSIVLFNNYYSAKDLLTSLYKPIEADKDFTSYLQRLTSKPFLEHKQDAENIYNGGFSFTLLDISKQEFWFREFYNGKEDFEQIFSQFITSPMRTAAKCYVFAKEKNEFISLFSCGFTGKCAADKMEHLLAWFSTGKKEKFAKSLKELEDSSEISDINYQLRLFRDHENYEVLAREFVNSLLDKEHREKDKIVKQQHDFLEEMEDANNENFQKIVNFFYNRFLSINRDNDKIKVKFKKRTYYPVYIVKKGKTTPTNKGYVYVAEDDFKNALSKSIIGIYF